MCLLPIGQGNLTKLISWTIGIDLEHLTMTIMKFHGKIFFFFQLSSPVGMVSRSRFVAIWLFRDIDTFSELAYDELDQALYSLLGSVALLSFMLFLGPLIFLFNRNIALLGEVIMFLCKITTKSLWFNFPLLQGKPISYTICFEYRYSWLLSTEKWIKYRKSSKNLMSSWANCYHQTSYHH